jgi:hypothetical protein
MSLYLRLLILLGCSRGWARTLWHMNGAVKLLHSGDTLKSTTTIRLDIPEKGADIKVTMETK